MKKKMKISGRWENEDFLRKFSFFFMFIVRGPGGRPGGRGLNGKLC